MSPTGKDYKKRDPLFGLAILKVSQQMRGQKIAGYDSIVQMTMAKLKITPADLNKFIKENRKKIEQAIHEEGLLDQ